MANIPIRDNEIILNILFILRFQGQLFLFKHHHNSLPTTPITICGSSA